MHAVQGGVWAPYEEQTYGTVDSQNCSRPPTAPLAPASLLPASLLDLSLSLLALPSLPITSFLALPSLPSACQLALPSLMS